ncbi:MAG: pentapeptide repeat-containing protein [Tildeniella torsiva UHER 1998/13D]|nr:pentapeptide repeat-containing protein [Tildeniella torsiva UHER 1998/13D]
MQWSDLASSGVDMLSSLGIQGNEVEAIAWLLVQRALLQAMVELSRECKTSLNTLNPDLKLLCDQLDHTLQTSDLSLTPDFFDRPKQLPVLEHVKEPYRLWLCSNGLSTEQAASLKERLPKYFVFALYNEWLSSPTTYALLQESLLDNPFRAATEREFAWKVYGAWLQREVDKPMFAEAFGLRQLYHPLRAYYEVEVKSQKTDDFERALPGKSPKALRYVVDLQTAILAWLAENDRTDTIRVICGGPGCGKSSFGHMIAAHLAETQTLPVLFVPLHQFDPSGDLLDSLNEFLRTDLDGILPPNPLEKGSAEPRVLLIFDGLDELEKQGKVAAQVAQDFVHEVQKKLLAFNQREARVFALLSGRDLTVQASKTEFRKEGQILHVLPYFQTQEELNKHAYAGEQTLLSQDQRQAWWQTYGTLKGKPYDGLPTQLNQGKLVEITAQPLLNYLVALSFDRSKAEGGIDFAAESNLNAIYNDLLDQVYQRDWAGYPHPTLGSIEKKDFVRILEEIAVACWHGNGRTSTINRIADRCASSTLKRVLEIFEGGAAEGVTRLLTAFYFRQSGIHGSEATFEFTHKSFGEYLTARRLVRELKLIQDELTRHRDNPDVGWDEKECLKRWVMLCGPTAMDEYLLSFLQDEVKLQPLEQVKLWQQTLCELIGYMLRQGMPMEELTPRPKFIEETQQARHASEALLAALSRCAWVTEEVSKVTWPTPEAFGTWLMTLQGQRKGNERSVALYCLNHLTLDDCVLSNQNLDGATFDKANLEGVNLEGVNLGGANLGRANLEGATFVWANLVWADLREANLIEADLTGARLMEADLGEANLEGADLGEANLEGANLREANLEGANLREANLEGADLRGANLREANLAGADLREANLTGAHLDGANLTGAHLDGANLESVNLEGAILEGAIR